MVYLMKNDDITTIKFFPIDDSITIDTAQTILEMENNDDINWTVSSTSSEQAYLRQDISLLYANGLFKGVFSAWEQDVTSLKQHLSFSPSNAEHLTAISFHHAEIHHADDSITSAQKMTENELFVVKEDSEYYSFHTPSNEKELKWKEQLNQTTNEQLWNNWHRLMNHFDIHQDDYITIPLIDLYQYETDNFPNQTREETKAILGKLWAGLYKNYVVLFNDQNNRESRHFMPLVLYPKNDQYLLVIYELNGQEQILVQQIPVSES